MATTWTVVLQPSRFSPHLQPTGFEGTWEEASAYGQSIQLEVHGAYLVPADATEQTVDSGRVLKIAPTAAAKAAAKERAAKIAAMLATDVERGRGWSALAGFAGRIAAAGDRVAAAEYAVDHGMTWSDVAQTQA